jgi:hypothetical protein
MDYFQLDPDKYTIVPASAKIIKLLLSDFENALESESTIQHPEHEDEEAGDSIDDVGYQRSTLLWYMVTWFYTVTSVLCLL